ncbi:hypothetical protein [Paenibacillus sp. FSL P4-0288]|uniref:hypothetical protein n=1 Tax=Paenibacillus sp. FSL P4-0288 TaxID=2921633 RepID=UPI0030FC4C8C
MDKYEQLSEKNSTIIEWEGKELRTILDPHVTDEGDHYIADALDADGNKYIITWEVIDYNTTDEAESCNWDHPVGITLVK